MRACVIVTLPLYSSGWAKISLWVHFFFFFFAAWLWSGPKQWKLKGSILNSLLFGQHKGWGKLNIRQWVGSTLYDLSFLQECQPMGVPVSHFRPSAQTREMNASTWEWESNGTRKEKSGPSEREEGKSRKGRDREAVAPRHLQSVDTELSC